MCVSVQNMVSILVECNLLQTIFKQTLMECEIFYSIEIRSRQNDPFENVKGAIKVLMWGGEVPLQTISAFTHPVLMHNSNVFEHSRIVSSKQKILRKRDVTLSSSKTVQNAEPVFISLLEDVWNWAFSGGTHSFSYNLPKWQPEHRTSEAFISRYRKEENSTFYNQNVFYHKHFIKSIPCTCTAITQPFDSVKLQLHDAIYRLRFYSNSLTRILSLSNLHNNAASIQKKRGDKSTIRRCDLSSRFFCIDFTLLCKFESDKIWINEFQ